MSNQRLYPVIEEMDLSDKVNTVLENAQNTYLTSINNIFETYKAHIKKASRNKRKYVLLKNVLMCADIFGGSALFTAGLVTEVVSMGAATPLTFTLGGTGMMMVATIPISNKFADKTCSKNRNLENLALIKFNQTKDCKGYK